MITIPIEQTISLSWNKTLGINLTAKRKAKRLIRKELAELTSISYALLEKIETGLVSTITRDNLSILATKLEIEIKDIYPVIEIDITEIS